MAAGELRARIRFDLDSHDTYTASPDDPDRIVPNPAKRKTHAAVAAARARLDRVPCTPTPPCSRCTHPLPPGQARRITNTDMDAITADQRAAETDLHAALAAHKATDARVPLAQVNPGQLVLDTQTKLLTTPSAWPRSTPSPPSPARSAPTPATPAPTTKPTPWPAPSSPPAATSSPAPAPDHPTGPLPTPRATAAMAELCDALTATRTRYPGTDLTLRFQAKPRR